MTDARDELARRAAQETRNASKIGRARRRAEGRAQQKEAAARKRHKKDAQRAPTSFVRTTRFFLTAAAGLVGVVVVVVLAVEGAALPWAWIVGAFGAWVALSTAFAVDHALWRARLPFKLVGYDQIGGSDRTDDDEAPFVAFRVQVVPQDAGADRAPIAAALSILAARVNAVMTANEDAKFRAEQAWRQDGDDAVVGEASFSIYTTKVLEEWLRDDAQLLARVVPLQRVVVDARYTGRGFTLPSGD